MFRNFMIIGLVAGFSAAAGVTITTDFFMYHPDNPLTPKWAAIMFGGVAGTILAATLLLYLITRFIRAVLRPLFRKSDPADPIAPST